MENGFELLDPSNARAFLKRFNAEGRRKGNSCYQRGCVTLLEVDEPGESYNAKVQEQENDYEVGLYYDGSEGWMGECSCSPDDLCHHQYAAMKALLAEHGATVVRNLSSGKSTTPQSIARAREVDPGIARKLTAVLRRPLSGTEAKFVKGIENAYTKCRQTGNITYWDFEEMGLRLKGYGWDAVKIWPAFPANEHEFWLYIAHAAKQHNVPIPEFMRFITDFEPIEERLRKWKRTQEIERWGKALADVPAEHAAASGTVRAETDLRLVVDQSQAILQWLRPGREQFENISLTQAQQIAQDEARGWIQFRMEAALLWQLISSRFYYGGHAALSYDHSDTVTALGRVLRTPLLESRIVNRQGEVLNRPCEPLRWSISNAETENDDYRFTLVTAEGTPVPPIFCVFPGKPSLYLTETAVFAGPPESVLETGRENRIPAPAIEQPLGVAFLQAMGMPLPPRVAARVRKVPLAVTIECQLKPTYPGSRTEDCCFRINARAENGYEEKWTGSAWRRTKEGQPPKRAEKEMILLYDRSALAEIPALVSAIEAKPGNLSQELYVRVTRRFPEVFSSWLKSIPPAINVKLLGELASFLEGDVAGKVRLDVSEADIDWFDLRVVLNISDTTLSSQEINLLLKARGQYVRLAGKGWRRLHYELTDEENVRLAQLGLSARELSDEPQRLHALQLADDAARTFLPEQQVARIQRRANELKARVAPPLPTNLKAELRPYQLEGFHFLAYLAENRFGGILADDMGLGKTLQALTWLEWLQGDSNGSEPSLVVCPKSVMDNWRAEAERFLPGLRVKVWPAAELDEFQSSLKQADLHVLNYSQLRSISPVVAPLHWRAVILDEGQYIKNPNSQTAQVARSLRAGHRLILSGTPIENRLMDLWSLMAFAMPGILGNRAQFGRLYDSKDDPFARRRLASRVRPFLLRRTKAQVAKDLPDRIEEDLFCEIEGEQKTLYRAELKRAQQILLGVKTQKELAKQQFHFLTSLLRLRQICCHPKLVNAESTMPGAKAQALLEQLEPLMDEGNKVLVFSQFVELLNLLKPMIEERGWPLFYLAGDTENRAELVQKFQSAEGPGVFLISLKAGGFGLNLTAASYVILFDPWWNPAVENQAIDRTHRIGQVNKVIAYRLLIKDSIEEKIRELQKNKKALAEDVLGEERFAQSLTLDDLRFLLSD